ncbi:MAG: hypothetical protein OXN16_08485 [Gammaproteobacteria bacterium]|nr:hypothetical protein [Gammaproteobacteria bacterium]MDE0281105.1 hypothetical protein [Gammaproteobacteria bacterium]MXY64308.1 hypothetical protein [Gammaproteobacteria bacterium]MYG67792.1 hypothetical protein [Gammaproteobacteria bacterium]
MIGGLAVPIVAVPQIEVGDDRIGAEDARCRLRQDEGQNMKRYAVTLDESERNELTGTGV